MSIISISRSVKTGRVFRYNGLNMFFFHDTELSTVKPRSFILSTVVSSLTKLKFFYSMHSYRMHGIEKLKMLLCLLIGCVIVKLVSV